MKALIYFPENKMAPKGGPAGYLYNLVHELKKNSDSYEVLPASESLSDNKKIRDAIPKRIKDIRRAWRFTKLYQKKTKPSVNLNEYDVVHFHSTEDLYYCREALEEYKGTVVLTSHSPCVYHQELLGRLNPLDVKLFKKKLKSLEQLDMYAFNRADKIIFPCEEAEEPYYHTWEQYKNIRQKDKYYYVPTGIKGCHGKVSRAEIRKQYGIPEDAFVVSYVGRHNAIKGYEDLKEIGKELLKDKNVWFLIAGKEGPLYRLQNEQWIEIGWTTDPHSYIAASDVFLLPNKETYFDLILLEVLSLGVPVIMSNTGGNQYFKKYGLQSLMTYENVTDAVEQVKKLQQVSKKERMDLGMQNLQLFQNEFTVEVFAKNYANTIESFVEEK